MVQDILYRNKSNRCIHQSNYSTKYAELTMDLGLNMYSFLLTQINFQIITNSPKLRLPNTSQLTEYSLELFDAW